MKPIKALAISPDGQFALQKKDNTVVHLIQLDKEKDNHQLIREFKLPYDPAIFSTSTTTKKFLVGRFSPCGKFVFFAASNYTNSPDQYNCCMSIETGLEIKPKCNGDENAQSQSLPLAFSHDGQYVVSEYSDKSVILSEVTSGKVCCPLISEETNSDGQLSYYIECCYFSSSNRYLVVELADQRKKTYVNNEFRSWIFSIDLFPPIFHQRVLVIDVKTGKEIYAKNFSTLRHCEIKFSPLEKSFLANLKGGGSVEWELIESASGQVLSANKDQQLLAFTEQTIVKHTQKEIDNLSLSSENEHALQPYLKSELQITNLAANTTVTKLFPGFSLTQASLSPNEQYLACGLIENHKDPELQVVLIRMSDGKQLIRRSACQFVFAEDSKAIFLLLKNGNYNYLLRQFDTADGTEYARTEMAGLPTSWIHFVLADGRVIMNNGFNRWIEELNHNQDKQLTQALCPGV